MMYCFLYHKAFKISISNIEHRVFFRHDRLLLSESGIGFYLVCTVRVTSLINGDRSHIDQMRKGNILYN